MNNIDNFVGIYENAFNQEYCEKAIKNFDELDKIGFGVNRMQHENVNTTIKNDVAIFPSHLIYTNHLPADIHSTFILKFWNEIYFKYSEKYAALKTSSDKHSIFTNKLQKTKIGEGYHVWHYESSTRETGGRLLSYILYLNDVEEGGETEFLYLHKRIKPKQGTLILFPGSFTHTHRGNPPLSNTKYIMTGWVEF
jgi:hypothetical protein